MVLDGESLRRVQKILGIASVKRHAKRHQGLGPPLKKKKKKITPAFKGENSKLPKVTKFIIACSWWKYNTVTSSYD